MKKQLLIAILAVCVASSFEIARADLTLPTAANFVETGNGTVSSNGNVSRIFFIDGQQWTFNAGNASNRSYQFDLTLSFPPVPTSEGQRIQLYSGTVSGGPITLASLTYAGPGFSRTVNVGTNFSAGYNYYQYSAALINGGSGTGTYSSANLDTLMLGIVMTRQDILRLDQVALIQTPEPGSYALFGTGLLVTVALVARRRRWGRRRKRRRELRPDVGD